MPIPRRFFFGASAVLLSGLLALAAAEFVLRHWLHAVPQLELDLYERDPAGNLRLRPGITRRHVTRLWDVTIRINSEGWRDDAPPAGAQLPVILGLGDSMAFGWGVEAEESFLALLEQRLGEGRARLVNAAVPGTGPGDQRLLLESIAPLYAPRAVILSLFVGNDFVDVQMGGARQFDVEDGLLIRRALDGESASWSARARSWLVRRSHLLQLVRAVQLNWSREDSPAASAGQAPRHWDQWMREFAQVHLSDYPERTRRAVDETLRILDQFEAFCRGRSIPFILVVIPRSYQVYPSEKAELLGALGIAENELDLDRPQRILSEWAAQRNVPLADLLPAFRAHQQAQPEDALFHYPDAHMTALGHRVAADAIAADQEVMAPIRASLTREPEDPASANAPPSATGTPLQ